MASAKTGSATGMRVIVHLDLDCFYAQVEQRRLSIPREEPLAVQQWGSLLAINYVARKFGVSRGDNVTEAKKKCPTLHVPHVELLGENRKPNSAYDRTHQKAILRRYRVASKAIYEILNRDGAVCERAGIDEAFLDLTELVRQRIEKMDVISSDFCSDAVNQDTKVVGISALEGTGKEIELEPFDAFPLTDEERWLCVGASITREIRKTIFDELGYTCSVGIATNKLVAKLASPLNKPDGQAILAPRFFGRLMEHFPLRKIRGLGGKLGRDLMALYYKVKGDEDVNVLAMNSWGKVAEPNEVGVKPTLTVSAFVEACSMEDIIGHVGQETAAYVRGVCDGDDGNEPVNAAKTEIKSFMAAKQYDDKSRLQHLEQLKYWLPILAEEVLERCQDEQIENKRFPAHVSISFTRVGAKPKSRNFPISLDATIESIVKAALAALQLDYDSMFPCASLSIHIKDFMPMSSRGASISTFFSKKTEADALNEHTTVVNDHQPSVVATTTASTTTAGKRKISSFFRSDLLPSGMQTGTSVEHDGAHDQGTAASATGVHRDPDVGDTVAVDAANAGPFFCEQCDKFVYEARREHTDYHYALKLSEAFAPASQSTQATVSTMDPKPPKKPRQGPMDAFLAR